MKISEIYSAMGLKIKLNYEDTAAGFQNGNLIRIEATQERLVYLVSQYGEGIESKKLFFVRSALIRQIICRIFLLEKKKTHTDVCF